MTALFGLALALPRPCGAAEIAFTSRFLAHPTGVPPGEMVTGDFDEDGRNDLAYLSGVAGGPSWISLMRGTPAGWSALPAQATGVGPMALVAADFDGDGHLDLASANYSSTSLSVLRGTGNGSFLPKINYAASSGPRTIAAGDVTGDGIPDLVTAGAGTPAIAVLRGDGSGGFLAKVDRTSGADLRALRLHDFDGDDHEDVVVLSRSGNSLLLHRALDDGALAVAQVFGGLNNPQDFDLGDFDQDGRIDVMVGQAPANLVLLRGGAGFALEASTTIPLGGTPSRVTVGHADPDAFLDVMATVGTSLVLVRGRGDGTFEAPRSVGTGAGAGKLILAELDGDPAIEIGVGCTGALNLSIYDVDQDGLIGSIAPEDVHPGTNRLLLHDYDRDGMLDLIQIAYGLLQTRHGVGDGTFGPPVTISANMGPPASNYGMPAEVTLGDFNADGIQDIAGIHMPNNGMQLAVFHGHGSGATGGFATTPVSLGTLSNNSRTVNTGDADGDGLDDVLVGGGWDPTCVVFRQLPGGLFARSNINFASPQNWATGSYRMSASDIDGDAVNDLVLSTEWGLVTLHGYGGGSFGAPVFLPGLPGLSSRTVTFADVDADGWMDVLGAIQDGNGYWLRGNGAGGFVAAAMFTPAGNVPVVWAGDVDLDGNLDVLAPGGGSSSLSVFRARGDGTFEAGRHLGLTNSVGHPALGDLDGDGWPEVVAGSWDGTVVLRNLASSVGVPSRPVAPLTGLALSSPFPNPMRGRALVELSLPDGRPAEFQVVDIRGRIVHRVAIAGGASGARRIDLALPRDLGTGLYFGRLVHPAGSRATKIVLQR